MMRIRVAPPVSNRRLSTTAEDFGVALERRDRHRYGGSDTVRTESPERYDRFW
jgi:hypothetical protein